MPFVILPTNSASGGYNITNSLRFNNGSSEELNFTVNGTPTHQDKGTWSFWIKRARIQNAVVRIFSAYADGGATQTWIRLDADNKLDIANRVSASFNTRLVTNRVFRDPSAWYYIVVAFDSTQATASDRVKLYINGVQETSFGTATYPSQNDNLQANTNGIPITWGAEGAGNDEYFDGYLSEAYFIDGQQLTPTSFGETDEDTGIWKPKAYTGTYGTNGFYLKFANSASLGTDSSGNVNTFTVNNLTSVDQSTDTPTNNFCTLNALSKGSALSLTNGNLTCTNDSTWRSVMSTIAISKGKWYWEAKVVSLGTINFGVTKSAQDGTTHSSVDAGRVMYSSNGNVYDEGFTSTTYSTGTTFTTNDIIGLALDCDNGTLKFYKNGTLIYTYSNTGLTTNEMTPANGVNSATGDMNFGSPPYSGGSFTDSAGFGNFSYQPPANYYSLCTKNLSIYG